MAADDTISPVFLREPYLSPAEVIRVHDVFEKSASLEMCATLTLGKTQNANESLHSVLWHNAPKTKYVGQKSLLASASLAVSTFNEGSMIFALILAELGVSCSFTALNHFPLMDKNRNHSRVRAMSVTHKIRRSVLKSKSLAVEASRRKREKRGTVYQSGAYGSEGSSLKSTATCVIPTNSTQNESDDSDTLCGKCDLRNCPIGVKRKNDDWVACEFCEVWYHTRCVKVSQKELGEDVYICIACEEDEQ